MQDHPFEAHIQFSFQQLGDLLLRFERYKNELLAMDGANNSFFADLTIGPNMTNNGNSYRLFFLSSLRYKHLLQNITITDTSL
jgi:hypothetical protein